jgi:hypothetical protein
MIIVDVSYGEEEIRAVAAVRYTQIKDSGDQRMKDDRRFFRGVLRSVATEYAAVDILEMTLNINEQIKYFTHDKPGSPDIVVGDINIDVKHLNENTRNASIEHWESTLDKKQDWSLMVIEGQGVGWKFGLCGYYAYSDLKHQPLREASKVHSRPFWLINEGELLPELSDTRLIPKPSAWIV